MRTWHQGYFNNYPSSQSLLAEQMLISSPSSNYRDFACPLAHQGRKGKKIACLQRAIYQISETRREGFLNVGGGLPRRAKNTFPKARSENLSGARGEVIPVQLSHGQASSTRKPWLKRPLIRFRVWLNQKALHVLGASQGAFQGDPVY